MPQMAAMGGHGTLRARFDGEGNNFQHWILRELIARLVMVLLHVVKPTFTTQRHVATALRKQLHLGQHM